MRKFFALLLLLASLQSFSQLQDSLLIGKWGLFKIIDNQTGNEIIPPANPNPEFVFFISFSDDSLVKFNLEINKCENAFVITAPHQIKFLYYAECSQICCDKEFSALLSYEDCTNYYIKNDSTLILVSEDRMYYFTRID